MIRSLCNFLVGFAVMAASVILLKLYGVPACRWIIVATLGQPPDARVLDSDTFVLFTGLLIYSVVGVLTFYGCCLSVALGDECIRKGHQLLIEFRQWYHEQCKGD